MVGEFAQQIIELRGKYNLTQTEFAERIGSTRGAVSSWERGDRTPTLPMINRIAKTFNCDYSVLASAKAGETILIEQYGNNHDKALESIVKKVLEMEKQETPTQRKAIDLIKQLDDASIEVIIPMLERML